VHPLGLSARLVVMEIFSFLCGGRHLRCRQTPGGGDPTDFTTTQEPEYLHAQAMRRQAKWILRILRTGAFSASTWFVGASRCNGDIQLFVVLWTSATTTQKFGHNSMRLRMEIFRILCSGEVWMTPDSGVKRRRGPPQHKKLINFITTRCADKTSRCA
jgi:hypothetical protein